LADALPSAATEKLTQTREPNRVVVFTGPKEGVGKSTLCLNLALAWAGSQNRKVIIVHMDPLCRNDLSFLMNVNPPTLASMVSMVGDNPTGLGRLLRGRIPMTQWGVGLLPLASKRSEIQGLSPQIIAKILGSLSESYDLFIDVDPFFPMQVFSFDLADLIFWTCLPQRSHFEATYGLFNEIKALHFPLEKFEIIVNEANLPGALAPKEVDRFFQAMQKRVLAYMPWEDLIPEYANTQRILVVENMQSEWVKTLRVPLGRTMEIKPTVKHWDSFMAQDEFAEGADLLWKQKAPVAGGGGDGKKAAHEAGSGTTAPSDLPAFWDELKGKMHKLVVGAMETERIRISEDATQNEENRSKVSQIIENLLQKERELALPRAQREQFVTELVDEILGYGPLQPLLRDPGVNEIMVNAFDKIYIERGGRLVLLPIRFRSDEQVVQVIKRIVAPVGRRIDESVPLVDARLKDGSRVNAIIAPLAVSGPTLTIRRFSAKPFTSKQLIGFGACTEGMIEFLKNSVIVRRNMIISGGTGTGKTTFLNMLSNYIPEDERIITVEDTAELNLMQEHWIRLESRPPNIEGKGEITIRDLIKNCLRMRPDRIVVGECRGGEALDMLQAMNTGHEGSLATIHANTPTDAVNRLAAMCLMAGTDLPMKVLIDMISSAVHMFAQLTRFADGKRRVTYITEVTGKDESGISVMTQDIFRFRQVTVDEWGRSLGYFTACDYTPHFHMEFKLKGLEVPKEIYESEESKNKKTNLPTPAEVVLKNAPPPPADGKSLRSGGH
jgi:Flp pilus assembly CpaF family ATPase/MinD-like ATPase involved in chromosome partitioning or flagellar assembly